MTIEDYLQEVALKLDAAGLCYGHGTDNPSDEAFYLVYGCLGIDFTDVGAGQRVLDTQQLESLEVLLKSRIDERVPTAYLLGRAWFAGYEFFCDDRALVPRSPIAELIMGEFQPLLQDRPSRVLDLCTGGGSIGIAMALQWPDCQIDLADISADALELAKKNIALHGLEARVNCIESDLFVNVSGRYDLIVANPPYVPLQEFEDLPDEFGHEPTLGLLSADEGLQIPLQILRDSVDHLRAGGLLVMEVGYSHFQLAERLRQVPLLWLDFEHGGEGVLALTSGQLQQYREQ